MRATNTRIIVFLSAKDDPPYCAQRGNLGPCEQWAECARQQDRKGFPPRAWFAAYPGTSCSISSINVDECQIERPSRPCDPAEKAEDAAAGHDPAQCARPNGFALADLVGANGGPEGVRRICTLPSTYNTALRDYKRTALGGFVPIPKTEFDAPPRRVAEPECKAWDFTRSGARLLQ